MTLYATIEGDDTLTVLTGTTRSIFSAPIHYWLFAAIGIAITLAITVYLFTSEDVACNFFGALLAALFSTSMIIIGSFLLRNEGRYTEFSQKDIREYTTKYNLTSMSDDDVNREIENACMDLQELLEADNQERVLYIARDDRPVELHVSYQEGAKDKSDKCFLKLQEITK